MSDLCPVAVSQDSTEDEFQPGTVGESNVLLLKQKKYCDVIFTFPNLPERIEAHEFCLKTRSPVFAKIFLMRKSGNVKGNEIEINESSPEIFQQFLEFLYADKLEVDIAGALDLLQLAQKYKVHPLIQKCEQLLTTEIPLKDSIKVFEAAGRHGREALMDRAGEVMVKSFLKLVRTDALMNAKEKTLVYLLDCDDLSVKEVGLFQFIVDWGKNQVGGYADAQLLRTKLENMILKIRYTNMAPHEFTKVVVPTGLLTAEEIVSVYSYICGDELTRRELKIKFNTIRRKNENEDMVTRNAGFYPFFTFGISGMFPAFSKQCISFKAEQPQVAGKVGSNYLLQKTVIAGITLVWPQVISQYSDNHFLNFNVSIREYSGPMNEGNCAIKFEKNLWSCKQSAFNDVAVEAPVELISGRTYSITVEDHSTSDQLNSFRNHPEPYISKPFKDTSREANVEFEDVCFTLKDTCRSTDNYHAMKFSNSSQQVAVIAAIKIGLM